VNVERLRSAFPIFEQGAYLNAGTNGPLCRAYATAVNGELEREATEGRSGASYWARLSQLEGDLRTRLAGLLGATTNEVALTRSTTDGIDTVLSGISLAPGKVVLTSDQEHPGVLGPLAGLRSRTGAEIRVAPFEELAGHVGADTGLIVVSHVSWMTGKVAGLDELASTGVPVLVDGAQAIGIRAVDVAAIGCAFYAASGQKWLCGPSGTGVLFVKSEWIDRLGIPRPRYVTLEEHSDPLELRPRPGAARFDSGELSGPETAASVAAIELLEKAGWQSIYKRSRELATSLRESLGSTAVAGDDSSLVSFKVEGDPDAVVARLDEHGVIVRSVPGRPWVRASIGAWNDERDLQRLTDAL